MAQTAEPAYRRVASGLMTVGAGWRRLRWAHLKHPSPWAVVFSPPLIGGGAGDQLRQLRWLYRRRCDLISFDYPGHGGSGGKFSLGATLAATDLMLALAAERAVSAGLPLFGLAACYGAIPLSLGCSRVPAAVKGVVLINPLTRLGPKPLWRALRQAAVMGAAPGRVVSRLPAGARALAGWLFPHTRIDSGRFGNLRRHRSRWARVIFETLLFAPLRPEMLARTPMLCLYSTADPVRVLSGWDDDRHYCRFLRRVYPQARFRRIRGDHYLRSVPSRRRLRRLIDTFLTCATNDSKRRPPCPVPQNPPNRPD